MKRFGAYIGGEWRCDSKDTVDVNDKFTGETIARVESCTPEQVDAAIDAAWRGFEETELDITHRVAVLRRVADAIEGRAGEFSETITAEGGFTIKEAAKEVGRAIDVLRISAEEAGRQSGELVPMEGMPGGQGKLAFMQRFPLGVVCAITPFNSPLNTPLHKIAPAIAAGNSVVIKPASQTPLCTAMLCDLFAEAGLPAGWLNMVTGPGGTVGEQLLGDVRIAYYHFTGSTEVGKHLASRIGLRKSSLELGSIAATIVCDDADLEHAVADMTRAAFAKAGQVCTSTQLIFAERKVYGDVCEGMARAAIALKPGDPRDADTDMGPLISAAEADRVQGWVDKALKAGAKRLAGGGRAGAALEPTVLVDVPDGQKVIDREIFGPVAVVIPVETTGEAIERYNASPYGLAAGIFTRDIERALHAMRRLRAGTVHINSASSSRLDAMPFGGVKDSGHGKEGPKYAMREMTEERLAVLHGGA